ncbi:hypothetical protein, partial [Salmonella enterica]|uniref:hypothetical protein n=1 Tax=Salmonella enterica TaxID=28901 RepID=UPI0019D5DD52
ATMKELELKYVQHQNVGTVDDVQNTSISQTVKTVIGGLITLVLILIALMIYNYMNDNMSYEALLEDEAYATIA